MVLTSSQTGVDGLFSIGGIADMPDAADSLQHSRRRARNTNIGYVLFVFGAVWLMAIAGMMAAAPK